MECFTAYIGCPTKASKKRPPTTGTQFKVKHCLVTVIIEPEAMLLLLKACLVAREASPCPFLFRCLLTNFAGT